MSEFVTRFAPSPTGWLHLGHAYSALFAQTRAERAGGRFLLRIEDIDRQRCRREFENALLEDLAWLGIEWEPDVRRQSDHFDDYARTLERLRRMGLIYPCFCTRKSLQREVARSGRAPHGPEGAPYPGICRGLPETEREERIAAGEAHAWRLDMRAALRMADQPLVWVDREKGKMKARPEAHGDVVLARKDTPTSYHLAVTVDDAIQGVTLVARGEDLLPSTCVHRLLQSLLDLPVPEWHHHRLLRDDAGNKLSKRDRPASLRSLRDEGVSPEALREKLGFDL